MNLFYSSILLLFVIFCCTDSGTEFILDETEKNVTFNEEFNEQFLEPLLYKKIYGSPSRFVLKDSFVFFRDQHNSYYIIDNWNIYADTSTIRYSIPFGTGPRELSYVSDMSLLSDTILQLYDSNINRLFQFSINDIKSNENPVPLKSLFIKDFFPKEPILIDDNQWLSNLLIAGDIDSRFILFDSLQNIEETNISYPLIEKQFQKFYYPELFNCSMCYNEKDQKLALAYYHLEQIELFSTQDTVYRILNLTGDKEIQPNFREVKTDDGAMFLEWTDDVHEVFFSIQCNEEYIFVVYNDSSKTRVNERWFDTILVLDWNGNIISRLKLAVPTMGTISVDFNNNQILAVSEVEDRGFVLYEYHDFN